MGADEVQINGIRMLFQGGRGSCRDARPIQADASQVGRFYSSPCTKPLYPVFQLAMIAGHDEEEDKKAGKRDIAELVPLLLKQRDRCSGADEKDGQSPSRKSCAGLGGTMEESVNPRHVAEERSISAWVDVYGRQGHSFL